MVSVGLLAAGVLLLAVGGFVHFDDFSGSAGNEWNMPLGAVAVVVAIIGVLVAVRIPAARLLFGVALGVLLAFLFWQGLTNRGFRFIWAHDEGELGMLEVVLGLLAAVLIATGLQPRPRVHGGRWMVRAAVYLCGAAVLVFVAVIAGTAYYNATDCESGDSDCLSLLGGMVWGLLSLPVAAVAVAVIEVVLHRRRNRELRGG